MTSSWMPCSLSAVSLLLAVSALAQTTPTTVSLTSSTNPAKFGLPVTLTATISSSAATGKVTFYSGTDILETVPIASGKAVLSTIALPFGSRSLYAYYGGDGTFAPSKSAVLKLTVNTAPGYGFQPVVSYPTQPVAITAADFNGDGIPDLAVVPDSPSPFVSVFIGKGDGSFQPAVSYPINGSPASIAAGDLNGDGHMDLVAGFYSGNEISVLLGNGDGTFESPVIYPAGSGPFYQVAVADLNGDGNADLIALNYDGEDVTVLIGNGDGTFQPPLPQNSGNYPNSIASEISTETATRTSQLGATRFSIPMNRSRFYWVMATAHSKLRRATGLVTLLPLQISMATALRTSRSQTTPPARLLCYGQRERYVPSAAYVPAR